jgi:hypothetical protein
VSLRPGEVEARLIYLPRLFATRGDASSTGESPVSFPVLPRIETDPPLVATCLRQKVGQEPARWRRAVGGVSPGRPFALSRIAEVSR